MSRVAYTPIRYGFRPVGNTNPFAAAQLNGLNERGSRDLGAWYDWLTPTPYYQAAEDAATTLYDLVTGKPIQTPLPVSTPQAVPVTVGVANALPTWAGGSGGALTPDQVNQLIKNCQAEVWQIKQNMIDAGYQPSQIPPDSTFQANADKCASDVGFVATLPPAQNPGNVFTWVVLGGIGLLVLSSFMR